MSYIVKGGEYKDPATFSGLMSEPIKFGPFEKYCEAYKVWNTHMRFNVDNHHYRLTIVPKDGG